MKRTLLITLLLSTMLFPFGALSQVNNGNSSAEKTPRVFIETDIMPLVKNLSPEDKKIFAGACRNYGSAGGVSEFHLLNHRKDLISLAEAITEKIKIFVSNRLSGRTFPSESARWKTGVSNMNECFSILAALLS